MEGEKMSDISGDIKQILEGISQPGLAVRENGIVVFANEASVKLAARGDGSLAGKNIEEIFPKKWSLNFRKSAKRSIDTGESVKFEETDIFAGKIIRTENNVFTSAGCAQEASLVFVIMTLRSAEEGALDISETGSDLAFGEKSFLGRQVKFILSATRTNLDIIDSAFNVRYVDDAWRKVYGDPDGKKCYEYFMDKNEPCRGCGVVESMADKKTVITEEVLVKENNRVVQVTTIPFQSESGEWLFAEVNVDISKRKEMEDEIKHMNVFLDSIIENMPNMIFLKKADDLSFVKFNRAGEELLGYKREELLGKTDHDIFPKEQADFFEKKDREALSGSGEVDISKEPINTRYKGSRILHTQKVPIRNEKGEAVFLMGVSEDITEKVRSEDELHKQWGLLSNLMDNIPFFVFWKDRESVYLGCNKAFAEVSGVGDPASIVGKTDYDLTWKKEESDFFRKIDREVMERGEPVLNIEEPQLQADGKEAIVLTSKVPLRDINGNITGILGIYTDITERKEKELRLKLFKDLMDQSSDSLFLINGDTGFFLDVNAQVSSSLGYSREELLKMGVMDIETAFSCEEELKTFIAELKIAGSLVFRGEHRKKGGGTFQVEVNLKYVEMEQNRYIIAVARDITERMEFELQLRDSEEKYRTIFANTGTMMAIVNGERYIKMANSRFQRFFGFDPETSDRAIRMDDIVHEDDLNEVKNYHRLRRIDPESAPSSYEVKMKDSSGKPRVTHVTVAMIPGTDMSVLSFLDFTDIKEKEIELEKQSDILNSTNKALEHKVAELNDALGHIKRLEGLVPICSSCKKIMKTGSDPKKTESWVNIEKYISDRTEASFTHGLCPDCIGKLYGDYVAKKKKKSTE
ncbi:MAG: PAS domain S-box protein [Candidatus Omnitrophota bacterium]